GTTDYLPMVRIRRVTDEQGIDRTTQTLRRREWLGTPPVKPFTEKPGKVWKRSRLLAGPRSECGSFLITESAGFARVSPGFDHDGEGHYLGGDIGCAQNVGARTSAGGSLFLAADGA